MKVRILVIDDKERSLRHLRDRLEEKNYEVITTTLKVEALKVIKSDKIDIIVTDLQFLTNYETSPKLLGFDLIKEVKTLKPEIEIIVYSGTPETEHRDSSVVDFAIESIKSGAFYYIRKSETGSIDRLLAVIEKAIEKKKEYFKYKDVQEELILSKWYEVCNEKDVNKKGKALEVLMKHIFESIEGFTVDHNVQTPSGDFDLVIENRVAKFPSAFGTTFLVECKNWSRKSVGISIFQTFQQRIKGVALCHIGFLASMSNFPKTMIHELTKDDILIVPITRTKIEELINSKNRLELIDVYIRHASENRFNSLK